MVDEPLIHATTYIPLMDNADSNPVVDKREVIDLIKPDQVEGIQKTGAKKLKIEADKGNIQNVTIFCIEKNTFLSSDGVSMFSHRSNELQKTNRIFVVKDLLVVF